MSQFSKRLQLAGGALALSVATTAEAQIAGSEAAEGATLTEVIVTAQRRDERLLDVPLSITVQSGESLERAGVAAVRDLHNVTPGLRIDRNGGSVQPAIRGVTAIDGNPGNDPNVAMYIDGVYRPSAGANNLDLPDVERIEVLKGPQGTLFGRNATGGAILIHTKRPTFDPEGRITLGYGNFDDRVAKGYFSGPLVPDKVAVSLAGFYERNDGYLHDLANGGRRTGALKSRLVRGKLLVKPTEKVSLLISGLYANRDDGSMAGQPYQGNTVARYVRPPPFTAANPAVGRPGVIIPTRPWDVANNFDPSIHYKEKAVSARADFDLGFANLSSISAYTHLKGDSRTESDYTNIFVNTYRAEARQKTFSQELNLTSSTEGPLNWVLGLFYYRDRAAYDPLTVGNPLGNFLIYGQQNSNAYAVFGEVSYDITDRLNLIAGLRYSRERRRLYGSFNARNFLFRAGRTFESTTPRVSLRYQFNDATNIYATYSQGFKSGGYTVSSLNTNAFLPEKVRAYEVGIKSSPRKTISFTAAAFYYDYLNQQVQTAVTINNAQVGVTANAASSEIYGAELDATVKPFPELTVSAAVSLLHARYKRYPNATVQRPRLLANGQPCLCGNIAVNGFDASGAQLIRSPDATFSLTGTYTKEFAVGTMSLSANLYYSDSFFFTPDNRVKQPSYTTVGARASFEPAGTKVKVSVWGRNLTNETVYQGASILADADGVLFAPPRSYGVELEYRF
jgi:iron complex outermembrane receptor protein